MSTGTWGGLDELCYRCGFAQDGALAWTMNLGALRLFDVATGTLWAELRSPRAEFVDAIEDVGGEWLVTLTKDGWLQRWPFDPVGYAQRAVPRSLEPEEYETYGIGDPAERARLVDRALEVLRRSAELGADPRVMAANGAPELFAGHAGFEALVGAAAAAGRG